MARLVYESFIGEIPAGIEVEHKDRNPANNCVGNLRLATRRQNMGNVAKYKGTSKYKGVYWHKTTSRWIANIKIQYKTKALGSFISEEEAALAYNKAAKAVFGEFALLNEV